MKSNKFYLWKLYGVMFANGTRDAAGHTTDQFTPF